MVKFLYLTQRAAKGVCGVPVSPSFFLCAHFKGSSEHLPQFRWVFIGRFPLAMKLRMFLALLHCGDGKGRFGNPLLASPASGGASRAPLAWAAPGWPFSVTGVPGSATWWRNNRFFPLDTMERWCGLGRSFGVSNASFSPLSLLILHINKDWLGLYQLPNLFSHSDLYLMLSPCQPW